MLSDRSGLKMQEDCRCKRLAIPATGRIAQSGETRSALRDSGHWSLIPIPQPCLFRHCPLAFLAVVFECFESLKVRIAFIATQLTGYDTVIEPFKHGSDSGPVAQACHAYVE